jgi:hypothetical protein
MDAEDEAEEEGECGGLAPTTERRRKPAMAGMTCDSVGAVDPPFAATAAASVPLFAGVVVAAAPAMSATADFSKDA